MWKLVFAREFVEFARNRRVVAIVFGSMLLLLVGLATGLSTVRAIQEQTTQAHAADEAVFVAQGVKNPHTAAHFGRVAFKPLAPFAVFDPGTTAYLGQAIWLEAHTRSPAMLRRAEDEIELSRLADFSVAGLLALVVPLLIVIIGGPTIAAERAQGTLGQALGAGIKISSVFGGKLLAVVGAGAAVSVIMIVGASLSVALVAPSLGDVAVRAGVLIVGYSVYAVGFAALALGVSACARSPAAAQLLLLSLWAMVVVVVPRLAGTVARQAFPTPDASRFWADTASAVAAERPKLDSPEFQRTAREVVARALDGGTFDTETASVVNTAAVRLEVGEIFSRRVYGQIYAELFLTYERQRSVRRWFSVLSPTIALRQMSAAVCGTDVAAHQHFSEAAERTREAVVRRMNEDMLVNGAKQGFQYTANQDLWAEIPTFTYRPLTGIEDVRRASTDLGVLAAWSTAACLIAWLVVRRSIEMGPL